MSPQPSLAAHDQGIEQRLREGETLRPEKSDWTLDRMRRLLADLGHPERRLPPVIHVAGTNGKGSTVAFIRAMAEAAGWRVHAYTSPHLVRFHERIRLKGRLVEDRHAIPAIDTILSANRGQPITYFELTTALAFHLFADVKADLVILETGLGGRLDATNVIERPAATAITRISRDHMFYLGPTLADIAREKAGIIKPGVPIITAPQTDANVRDILAATAAAQAAPHLAAGRDWDIAALAAGFRYRARAQEWDLPQPALLGAHQYVNAATAIACLEQVPNFPLTQDIAAKGVTSAVWRGRLERLPADCPYARLLPQGSEVWLDGAHNDSGGEVLAAALHSLAEKDGRPTDLVVGMLATKAHEELLAPLLPYIRSLSAIAIPGDEHSAKPRDILAAARRVLAAQDPGGQAQQPAHFEAPTPKAALGRIAGEGYGDGRVVICGSLHLAGCVLSDNGLIPE